MNETESRVVRARLTFVPASEGGRSTPASSGIKPLLKLGRILTSCVVRMSNGGDGVFVPGQLYEVTLEILFWSEYGPLFDATAPVELYDGSRLIAKGNFV